MEDNVDSRILRVEDNDFFINWSSKNCNTFVPFALKTELFVGKTMLLADNDRLIANFLRIFPFKVLLHFGEGILDTESDRLSGERHPNLREYPGRQNSWRWWGAEAAHSSSSGVSDRASCIAGESAAFFSSRICSATCSSLFLHCEAAEVERPLHPSKGGQVTLSAAFPASPTIDISLVIHGFRPRFWNSNGSSPAFWIRERVPGLILRRRHIVLWSTLSERNSLHSRTRSSAFIMAASDVYYYGVNS